MSTPVEPSDLSSEEPQQPEQDENHLGESAVLAVLVVLIAGPPLAEAVETLGKILAAPPATILAALNAIHYKPGKKSLTVGSGAARIARAGNMKYRAAFLINSVKRLASADDLSKALKRERSLFKAHKQANKRRLDAAFNAANLADAFGMPLLGWNATLDSATTPDCAVLDGKNFYVDKPPGGLYPGARHPRCRCTAGLPFHGAPIV